MKSILAVVVMIAASSVVRDQPHEQRFVIVAQRPGVPLLGHLPPGDLPVRVERRSDPPLAVLNPFKTAQEEVAYHSREADGALVLSVEDVSGSLTENDSWMRTQTSGRVLNLVKSPRDIHVAQHERVTFSHDGGELRLVGRRVVVGAGPWFHTRKSYLVFFDVTGDGDLVANSGWLIRSDQRLGSLGADDGGPPELGGMRLGEVVSNIRRAIAQ